MGKHSSSGGPITTRGFPWRKHLREFLLAGRPVSHKGETKSDSSLRTNRRGVPAAGVGTECPRASKLIRQRCYRSRNAFCGNQTIQGGIFNGHEPRYRIYAFASWKW